MHFVCVCVCVRERERDSIGNLCAAVEFYSRSSTNNQNVQKLTKSWGEVPLAIADLDVHA